MGVAIAIDPENRMLGPAQRNNDAEEIGESLIHWNTLYTTHKAANRHD
jgi:hypothetical protein